MATSRSGEVVDFQDRAEQSSNELAVARDQTRTMQEVQGAIIVAQKYRRNEDEARIKLLRSCKRPGFADEAEYVFPRGGNDVSGPSVTLAREAARVWGNIQYGFEIISEDDVWRSLRAYAWDVESNSKVFQEDRFKKLIQRKVSGKTEWVRPDERDLRELTNRRAAIAYRNCVLQLIPRDIIDEALAEARATLKNRAATDPNGERKRIMDAFSELNIMPTSLDAMLGHPVAQASPAEIVQLRAIYRSIRDGNSTLSDYTTCAPRGDDKVAAKSASNLDRIREDYDKKNPKPNLEGAAKAQDARPPQATTEAPSQDNPSSPAPETDAAAQKRREELHEQGRQVTERLERDRREAKEQLPNEEVEVKFGDG